MPLITGPEACEEARVAFHAMIKAAAACRRQFPIRSQVLLLVSQLSACVTGALLGGNVGSSISPLKIHLSDTWVVVLSVILMASLITLVRLALLHNKLVKPIHNVLKQNASIRLAKQISLEFQIDRQVTTITTKNDDVVFCDLIFNPADIELVQLAYQLAAKKPPEIVNLLGSK
ncbi:MAG: hypothetical protein WCP91_01955 [Candidatus Berkelbacteria bacterium]